MSRFYSIAASDKYSMILRHREVIPSAISNLRNIKKANPLNARNRIPATSAIALGNSKVTS